MADSRSGLHARLQALVPGTEQQRFARALAALEAYHGNELHAQTRAAHESGLKGQAASEAAAVLKRASAAKEAKLQCQIEALKSEASRRERQLAERTEQAAAAVRRAESSEARARVCEALLTREMRLLEGEQKEGGRLLRELSVAHDLKTEHLLGLQASTSQAVATVATLQDQASSMAKRLAAQQRKTMRLQESQHLIDATARSWAQERKALLLAAARADQASREAQSRLQALEAQHASLVGRVEQERRGSAASLRQTREVSAASEAALRSDMRALQALRDALLVDPCRVKLRSGSECTVAQYVKALEERQMRARRGRAGSEAVALAGASEPDAFAPPMARAAMPPPMATALEEEEEETASESAAAPFMPSRIMLGGGGGVSGSLAFNR